MSRTKTDAMKVLLAAGWTYEEISAVLGVKPSAPSIPHFIPAQTTWHRVIPRPIAPLNPNEIVCQNNGVR